jgi:hypothetical protein
MDHMGLTLLPIGELHAWNGLLELRGCFVATDKRVGHCSAVHLLYDLAPLTHGQLAWTALHVHDSPAIWKRICRRM